MEFSTLNGYKVKDKKAIRYYDTINDMKSDTTLKNGMYVKTKGYYTSGDCGHGEYIIVNDTELVEDSGLIHILDNGLRAKLIQDRELNIKQFGAYGDNIHDDSDAFKKLFEVISKDLFYDSELSSNKSLKYNINIPNGTYLIQSADLLQDMTQTSMFNLLIKGNNSKLIFDNFVGSCFVNADRLAKIQFDNIIFLSSNDEKDRILFDNYSTGQTQDLKFNNCSFSGNWKYIFKLTGTDNNSEYLFNECSMNGKWTSFLYNEEDTASDQFVNYWFNNCKYWCSSNWINIKKGGHIKLNNCDISGYQPETDTYLYEFGVGSVALGVAVFIDEGSRYELKTSHAKVLKSNWDNGIIHFNNVDFSSQANNNQIEQCFYIKTAANSDNIRFSNCNIYGKFYITTSANISLTSEVVLENCCIIKGLSNLVEFYTQYTHTPSLRLINCTVRSDNKHYFMLFKNNNENFNRNVLQRNIYTYEPNGSTSATLHTYIKPYYVESVAFGKDHLTYDNNTTIKVKCLLGTITASADTTHFNVSDSEFKHFRKGMNIEINGRSNTITNTNMGSKSINIQNADSSITIGETVYIILYSIVSNAYFGQATSKEEMHWKLYNDLLFEATAATVGELMYEIIE